MDEELDWSYVCSECELWWVAEEAAPATELERLRLTRAQDSQKGTQEPVIPAKRCRDDGLLPDELSRAGSEAEPRTSPKLRPRLCEPE